MTQYYVPAKTDVLIHYIDAGWDLTLHFEHKCTEHDVYYSEDDVWFSPIFDFASARDPQILWDSNSEDQFAMVKNSMYGFAIPENVLNISHILVPQISIKLIYDKTPKADPRKTSVYKDARVIRRIRKNLKL